jgi:Phosphotransferase enzyme family
VRAPVRRDAVALRSLEEITPAWCSAALAPSVGAGEVVACAATPIGTGQVADTARVELAYDPPGAGPRTCVVKFTSASPGSRAAAKVTRSYEVEAGFYRDLAPTLPVRLPHCFFTRYDDQTGGYTVVLEDLAPARSPDQLAGCDAGEIAAAVEELAALHAARWGDPALAALPWMPRHDGPAAAQMGSLVAAIRGRFLRRYGDRLLPEVAALVDRFTPHVARYLSERPGPRTVAHGDFRADNLMFRGGRVTVVDWQTVANEPGVTDLAYLLGASVATDARRRIERDVVRRYADALRRRGVDVPAETCWTDYRRYAFGGLLMAIVASALVVRTDRGEDMFAAMANRHGLHALDLEAESFLVN